MPQNSAELIKETRLLKRPLFESIIRTLLYFDIFNYPLKKD
jgi:hypothetical protein